MAPVAGPTGRQHLLGDMIEVRQLKTGTESEIPVHPAPAAELAHVPTSRMVFLQREHVPQGLTANGFYMWFREWCAEAGAKTHQIVAVTGRKTLSEVEVYSRAAAQKRPARDGMAKVRKMTEASNPGAGKLPTRPKTGG
jgi:hypothetical protein